MTDRATVSVTNLIIASSRLMTKDNRLYRLEQDYANGTDDSFLAGEALVMARTGQLCRLGAHVGDPAISFFDVVEGDYQNLKR